MIPPPGLSQAVFPTISNAEPLSRIEPDRGQAERYLALLDPQAEKWTFLTFDDVELPDGKGGWKKRKDGLIGEFHGALNDHWETLVELNRRGAGIYVTVNETDFQGRGANNIRRIRAVWRDDDDGGARGNMMGQPAPITASLIVQTSPTKYQDYWFVDGLSPEEHAAVIETIVQAYGGDNGAKGINRVLRLPGFCNMKRLPFQVRICGGAGRFWKHSREDVLAAFPPRERAERPSARFGVKTTQDFQPQRVVEALRFIRPEARQDWLDIGMVLHHATGGGADGLDIWDRWSQAALEKYDSDDQERTWKSFRLDPKKALTLGTLFYRAEKNGWNPRGNAAAEFSALPGSAPVKAKLSNAEAARAFALRYSVRHKFNHTTKHWMAFTGSCWEQDRQGETVDVIAKFCERSGNGSTKFAKDTEQLARNMPEFRVTSDMFDRDDWLLGTPAGYVDLRTGSMSPPDPELLVSKLTAVSSSAKTPDRWYRFLHEITDGDLAMMHFLWRLFGYALTGNTREQVFVFIHGAAGSGKSTLVQAIAKTMGSYHKAGNIGALLTSRNSDANAPQPFLAPLAGARLTTMPETKTGMVIDVPTIARLTGEDAIMTRNMYGNAFQFHPKFKAIIYGNQAPSLSGSSPAIARRALVIPLNVVFKGAVGSTEGANADPELMKKLEAEQDGILNWLIKGCLEWQRIGLKVPVAVANASREFVRDADPVATWIEEALVKDPKAKLRNDEAFANYQAWARQRGHEPGSIRSFGHKLSEHLGKPRVGVGHRYRLGWRLAPGPALALSSAQIPATS